MIKEFIVKLQINIEIIENMWKDAVATCIFVLLYVFYTSN